MSFDVPGLAYYARRLAAMTAAERAVEAAHLETLRAHLHSLRVPIPSIRPSRRKHAICGRLDVRLALVHQHMQQDRLKTRDDE